jgi:hypothetical protein
MTRRWVTISLMLINVIGSVSLSCQAQDPDGLKGINVVYVLVEDAPEGAKILGITAEDIQNDVEIKLLLAGMGVATLKDGHNLPGRPHIYVRFTLTRGTEAASIQVELDQDAVLERNAEHAPSAMTWNAGYILANPTALGIRDEIKRGVDAFLNAWLSANSKK